MFPFDPPENIRKPKVKWKGYGNSFHFPELYSHSKNKIKVELDFSDYPICFLITLFI